MTTPTPPDRPPRNRPAAVPYRALPKIIVTLVWVSVIVNVLMVLAFGIGGYLLLQHDHDEATASRASISRTAAKASELVHQEQLKQCAYSNAIRAKDEAIWDRLLKPLPPPLQTPPQIAEAADIRALVKAKDTPSNCAALYPAIPPEGAK